ncbi:hypothetical protein [Duganella sp. P38]|uniref:hypothetical protein n=1 Tax=Duganella sp. P38 TaxID=3423949 RepID=UPI003D7A1767
MQEAASLRPFSAFDLDFQDCNQYSFRVQIQEASPAGWQSADIPLKQYVMLQTATSICSINSLLYRISLQMTLTGRDRKVDE